MEKALEEKILAILLKIMYHTLSKMYIRLVAFSHVCKIWTTEGFWLLWDLYKFFRLTQFLFFFNWNITDIHYYIRHTSWFNVCIYCATITTIDKSSYPLLPFKVNNSIIDYSHYVVKYIPMTYLKLKVCTSGSPLPV